MRRSRDTDERKNGISTVNIKFNNKFAISQVRYFMSKTTVLINVAEICKRQVPNPVSDYLVLAEIITP